MRAKATRTGALCAIGALIAAMLVAGESSAGTFPGENGAILTDFGVAISPDGKRVLEKFDSYKRDVDFDATGNRIVWIKWGNTSSSIHVTDLITGDEQKLFGGGDENGLSSPTWSPDGTRVAFWWSGGSAQGISIINVATGERTRVFDTDDFTEVAWAPDRDVLAVGSDIGTDSISLLTLGPGTASEQMLSNTSNCFGPQWHPSGTHLVMACQDGPSIEDNNRIVAYEVASQTREEIFNPSTYVYAAAWSPDGQRIALSEGNDDGRGRIHIITSGGTLLRTVNSPGESMSWQPCPEGECADLLPANEVLPSALKALLGSIRGTVDDAYAYDAHTFKVLTEKKGTKHIMDYEVRFKVPADLRDNPTPTRLRIETERRYALCERITAWDPSKKEWSKTWQSNRQVEGQIAFIDFSLPDPARYIASDGTLRIRSRCVHDLRNYIIVNRTTLFVGPD